MAGVKMARGEGKREAVNATARAGALASSACGRR
jgi:hypothetical protein